MKPGNARRSGEFYGSFARELKRLGTMSAEQSRTGAVEAGCAAEARRELEATWESAGLIENSSRLTVRRETHAAVGLHRCQKQRRSSSTQKTRPKFRSTR